VAFLPISNTKSAEKPAKSQPNVTLHHRTATTKPGNRGCEHCPLNEVKGLHKVFGKVRGKSIFIWAQSPGPQENKAEKELIGPSGEFLWFELARVGIKRKMCDIQNVVRCMPADRQNTTWPPLKMRSPSPEEIKCCSIYNEQALEKSKARLHLVFGQVAAKSLLKGEFNKDKRIFFSDVLKGWVVYLDHPAYFIRQGYRAGSTEKPSASLVRFREDLKRAKAVYKSKKFDRFEFVKSQGNIGITTRKMARWAYNKLVKAAKKGYRLVADMEEGRVDKHGEPDDKGTSVALCCGFTAKPGTSYTFALAHPDAPASKECRQLNRTLVQKLLNRFSIKKAFHYGVSDVDAVQRLLNTKVNGFDYDTLTASFFDDPDAKSYGLDKVSQRSYPDFQDYKDIIGPESFTKKFKIQFEGTKKYDKLTLGQRVDLARRKGQINLARLPWKKMVVYNGSDCHLEKLIERDTDQGGNVNQALMQLYIDSSFILYRMERDPDCRPLFDYNWHAKLVDLVPKRVKVLERKLRKLAGKYAYIPHAKTGEIRKIKFKPNSRAHLLWLIYTKMKCKFTPERGKKGKPDKPNTRANSLKRLAIKYPKVAIVPEYSAATKMMSTYVTGYYKCAELNDGHLRTNWKQTGTGSGRLSSGKTKDKTNDAVINFQNIHGDPLIKCLLIADLLWRKLYKHWTEHATVSYIGHNKNTKEKMYSFKGGFTKESWTRFENLYVFLGFDFSQMELRVLCQESHDKGLIKMFSMGTDPHVEVGHALTGWAREVIARDERRRKLIKNMQFGLVYGLQGEGLFKFLIAQGVKTTRKEVDEYHGKYFRKFPGVKLLYNSSKNFLEDHGYVENLFGFRRHINVDEQKQMGEEYEGAYWGNQALNTKIQGAAAQMLFFAIAMLYRNPKKYHLLQHPQLEIHDALYFRVKLKHLMEAIKQGDELMVKEPVRIAKEEFHIRWKVPLQAKPKAGVRFGVMVEGIGKDKIKHEWDFLNEWCLENYKLDRQYKRELREFVN